jgi:hypothetical protein
MSTHLARQTAIRRLAPRLGAFLAVAVHAASAKSGMPIACIEKPVGLSYYPSVEVFHVGQLLQ